MWMFFAGLSLFFTLHLAAATPRIRAGIVASLGENPWKGLVALGSLGGIVLIGQGWSSMPNTPLFAPVTELRQWAPILVSISLVLFVIGGGNLKGHIKHTLHHPMLAGVILWSGTHLLVNGGLRETWLFGAFLAFAVYALCSLLLAGKRAAFVPAWKRDAVGVGIGLFVAIGVMHGHLWLFGVPV